LTIVQNFIKNSLSFESKSLYQYTHGWDGDYVVVNSTKARRNKYFM